MKVAVLGGGHGGHAAAADLALQGHEVASWRRDAAALAGLGAAHEELARAVLVTKRSPLLPDAPTIAEAGFPQLESIA